MITVADILSLPAFEHVEPIAVCNHAGSRPVHNVGIMDVSPDYNEYSVYMPGEFIVTNLGFANGDEKASEQALVAMISRGVSAIAVKTVYGPSITDRVREVSLEYGVPVYLYTGAYHEMVAYQALDLLRRDERESDVERAVKKLLNWENNREIRDHIYDMTKMTGATMRCIAVAPCHDSLDECSLHAMLGSIRGVLAEFASAQSTIESTFACRFECSILVFISYITPTYQDITLDHLKGLLISIGPLCLGVGDEVSLSEGDITLRQALALLEMAVSEGRSLEWLDVHERAFAYAARSDVLFSRTSQRYLGCLQEYDRKNSSALVATARAFAQTFGEIKTTADVLYQHQNTVRYRLRKIKTLLNMADASDRELARFLVLLFLVE